MEYPFENLGADRFQQFCQALLACVYPDIICFPVGQPDGGRDAIRFLHKKEGKNIVVYQVKYAKKPFSDIDPHKWLVDIIKGELPKINKLIPKGANRYILITNIQGTSHLDSGSIDKLWKELTNLKISFECWWRDDLSRRLDSKPELRWAYPELIMTADILKRLLESDLSDKRNQRTSIIKAFLRDQYEKEKDVRFKQVELINRLLDLFIDVPIILDSSIFRTYTRHSHYSWTQIAEIEKPSDILDKYYRYKLSIEMNFRRKNKNLWIHHSADDQKKSFVRIMDQTKEKDIGAATFFLVNNSKSRFSNIILEGAPGQGKSTITQYICQVHRIRLLNEKRDLRLLPKNHQRSPIKLPIRIDLRDFAIWLNKKNPFSFSSTTRSEPLSDWHGSLEAFIAALIRFNSGGGEFLINDLFSVLKETPILIVLDGLDEIADIKRRKEVVDAIKSGINRLRENAVSLHVIVTSRPTAFTNSPGFSSESFQNCHLESLPRSSIEEYTEKWIKAKQVLTHEKDEIRRTLYEKLDQPHLRDLARNPMQLAILLSLIHIRGESLPEKRTELYDCYVDLFFTREAQKSKIVKKYRELLISIHQFLAWVLHSEAEINEEENSSEISNGSISINRLKELVTNYLEREGHNPTLTSVLFTGMVERVVAIVSRVEGTYEFEVQTLREYFAARYLYETAPYSPPGSPRKGNLIERFSAISKNFYWLNVTRFFSGCFSIGQLPSLVDQLEELINIENYSRTSHPRFLSAILLADWVFSQHPKSMNKVISYVLDGIGLRLNISNNKRLGYSSPLILPKKCGGDKLVSRCFDLLKDKIQEDYASDVIEIIKFNSTRQEIYKIWFEQLNIKQGVEKTKWLEYGLFLEVIPLIPKESIELVLEDVTDYSERLLIFYKANYLDFIINNENYINALIKIILNEDSQIFIRKVDNIFDELIMTINPSRYAISFSLSSHQNLPLYECWSRNTYFIPFVQSKLKIICNEKTPSYCGYQNIQTTINKVAKKTIGSWARSLSLWDEMVESIRLNFGESRSVVLLANIASAIKSKTETCREFDDLFNNDLSLCRRVRYARLRAGNPKWWKKQFACIETHQDIFLANLILFTWGSIRTIISLTDEINSTLKELNSEQYGSFMQYFNKSIHILNENGINRTLKIDSFSSLNRISPRGIAAINNRLDNNNSRIIYNNNLKDYKGTDRIVWDFCCKMIIKDILSGDANWISSLNAIKKGYKYGSKSFDEVDLLHLAQSDFPLEIATIITKDPESYPEILVTIAETICRKEVSKNIVPVAVISESNRWFD